MVLLWSQHCGPCQRWSRLCSCYLGHLHRKSVKEHKEHKEHAKMASSKHVGNIWRAKTMSTNSLNIFQIFKSSKMKPNLGPWSLARQVQKKSATDRWLQAMASHWQSSFHSRSLRSLVINFSEKNEGREVWSTWSTWSTKPRMHHAILRQRRVHGTVPISLENRNQIRAIRPEHQDLDAPRAKPLSNSTTQFGRFFFSFHWEASTWVLCTA